MKTKFILLITFLVFQFNYCYSQCAGEERWEEKVLTDSASKDIDFTASTEYTKIQDIREIEHESVGDDDKRKDIEFKTVEIKCKIKKYKFVGGKKGDNDYHVVIFPVGKPEMTMVAEIPDPTCDNVKSSKYKNKYKKARKFIDTHSTMRIGSSQWFGMEDRTYTIYGVLFRDQKHGVQPEQAPNFIEIHPILNIK